MLIVLLSRSLGILADAARNPEGVNEIRGQRVRLAAESRTDLIGGVQAVRLVYETLGMPRRRTVAWILPTEPFLALGAEVSASDELHLDTLVEESVSRSLDRD